MSRPIVAPLQPSTAHVPDGESGHPVSAVRPKRHSRTCPRAHVRDADAPPAHVLDAKAAFRRALDATGPNPPGRNFAWCAKKMGVNARLVARKASDEHKQVPTLPDLFRAPASVRREVARLLDAEDVAAAGVPLERHVVALSRELGDVARALEDAGCTIDADEAARLDRELVELIERAVAARAELRGRLGR